MLCRVVAVEISNLNNLLHDKYVVILFLLLRIYLSSFSHSNMSVGFKSIPLELSGHFRARVSAASSNRGGSSNSRHKSSRKDVNIVHQMTFDRKPKRRESDVQPSNRIKKDKRCPMY